MAEKLGRAVIGLGLVVLFYFLFGLAGVAVAAVLAVGRWLFTGKKPRAEADQPSDAK